jgi:hypothetical protein
MYLRRYELHHLRIAGRHAPTPLAFDFTGSRTIRRCLRTISDMLPHARHFYFAEPGMYGSKHLLVPELLRMGKKAVVFLQGYWQSEYYFADARETLRQEFQLRNEPLADILRMAQAMENEESVALGFRSYAEVPAERRHFHTSMPAAYYTRALAVLRDHVSAPRFYLFSDMPELAMGLLDPSLPITVVPPPTRPSGFAETLWLMSRCRHFVIANSSFHWWGAWLGEKETSLVVAPDRGFFNEQALPARWRVLSAEA